MDLTIARSISLVVSWLVKALSILIRSTGSERMKLNELGPLPKLPRQNRQPSSFISCMNSATDSISLMADASVSSNQIRSIGASFLLSFS